MFTFFLSLHASTRSVHSIQTLLLAGQAKDAPLAIASNKSCFGHTEGAAGLTGMLLALQACSANALPPVMHLRNWNPHVASALDGWQSKARRAAAIPLQQAGKLFRDLTSSTACTCKGCFPAMSFRKFKGLASAVGDVFLTRIGWSPACNRASLGIKNYMTLYRFYDSRLV